MNGSNTSGWSAWASGSAGETDIGHPEAVSCMPHRDLNSGPLELIPCGGFEEVTKEVRAWSEKVSRSCT